jgi:hypothetical protein
MDHRLATASRVVRNAGIVLLVVAVIHLIATPMLARFLSSPLSEAQWKTVGPPSLLNHVVVGVLLVPIGFTLVVIAPHLRDGARWAWRLALIHALAVASLPLVLVAIMPLEMFAAVPFLVAAILVTLAALVLPGVVIWARPRN